MRPLIVVLLVVLGVGSPQLAHAATPANEPLESEEPQEEDGAGVEVAAREEPPIPGDLNLDNAVDSLDLNHLFAHFGEEGMDGAMFVTILCNWAPPPVYIVPLEPTNSPRTSWRALVYSVGGVSSVRLDGRPINYDPSSRLAWVDAASEGPHRVSARGNRGAGAVLDIELGSRDWVEVTAPYPGAVWTNEIRIPCDAENVVARGWTFTPEGSPKVSPQCGDKATRQIWLTGCTAIGNGGSMPLASATMWGGGVWMSDCVVDELRSLPANARGIAGLTVGAMRVDLLANVRAAYDIRCELIRKLDGTAHPDALQGSFQVDPGPVAYSRIFVREAWSQAIFFRCDAVEAIGLFEIEVSAPPEVQYISQIRGAKVQDLVMDGVTLHDQGLTICNDVSRRVSIRRYDFGAIDVVGGLRIDPSSGIPLDWDDDALFVE